MKTLLDKPLLIKDPDYKQKILLFDIENSPLLSYNWGIWEQNAIEVKEEWYILSFAYKWLGEKEVHVLALPDFRGYKKDKTNDYRLVQELWKLFNKADVLIAHNGNAFDIKKANARFLIHGMEPPNVYKSIDTLTIARRYFKLDSNKLDDLGQYLKLGRKLPHTGKHLWFGCMAGDPASWKLMKDYNKQDVVLLEKVYRKLRGWDTNQQVNMNMILGTMNNCPRCGCDQVIKAGFKYTAVNMFQTYRCLSCGHRPQGERIMRPKVELK